MDPGSCLGRISGILSPLKRPQKEEISEEVISVFLDVSGEASSAGDCLFRESAREIIQLSREMKHCTTKGELLSFLAEAVMRYRLEDLEQMNANFGHKVEKISASYREKLLPKIHEQIFGTHHSMLLMYREGGADRMDTPLRAVFPEFCEMVREDCMQKAHKKDRHILFLKYLLSAFTMFVIERPAHPVGTPFPGGQIVDEWDGVCYCPVRDKSNDVAFSLCQFCPAIQGDELLYPWSRSVRRKREKQECLENYWTNFKG